jgi:hypothetical protein
MSNHAWGASELKFLRRFYRNTANRLMCAALGRSEDSVRHKANRMGIFKNSTFDNAKVRSNSGMRYTVVAAKKLF